MVDRNAEALAKQLLELPSADRARLAELLIASLEATENGVKEAWDQEASKRAAELGSGSVRGIPAKDVFAEIDRRLRR